MDRIGDAMRDLPPDDKPASEWSRAELVAFLRANAPDGVQVEALAPVVQRMIADGGDPRQLVATMRGVIASGADPTQMLAMASMGALPGQGFEQPVATARASRPHVPDDGACLQAGTCGKPDQALEAWGGSHAAAAQPAAGECGGAAEGDSDVAGGQGGAASALAQLFTRARLKKAGIVCIWLVVWELLDRLIDNRLVMAGPIRTLQALASQIAEADFWLICAASFGRIALGFFLSFATGIVLAMLAHRFRTFKDFVDPVISLLRTVPVVTFIILLLIWMGNQWLTVFLAFFIVLPIIYTNMIAGFGSVDPQLIEMARVFGLSRWRTFAYIYRPAFMPFLVSACKLSLGMSWKSGIMAEVLATPKPSIGKEMAQARTFLDTPDVFAWTVVIMVLSWLFEKLVLWALHRASRPCGGMLGKRDGQARRFGSEGAVAGDAPGVAPDDSASAGEVVIQMAGLCKSFGENCVLRNVTFALGKGMRCCLMAPSGSGKTTLLRVLLGLEQADGGYLTAPGVGGMSMMFQEDRLCDRLSPVDNVALVLPKRVSRKDIAGMLSEILPESCLGQPAIELSGGMRRRVALVRAMAYGGDAVILDEPFTGLDMKTRHQVIEFVSRHAEGRALLVATHGEDDASLLGAVRVSLEDLQDGGAEQ